MDFQHSHIQNHQSRSKLCKQHIFTCRRNLSFAILIATAGVLSIISKAEAHDQNAPPILYVRERNWRISEAEKVGQIIDRVRAEDPDGDELLFGIEPRFLPPQGSDVEASIPEKLPFHIDSQTGVVYLNESLMGRAGQNFLIYITVSDGRYTAKNEVFINILGQRENMYGYRPQTSISNVVHNISQFLPSFDQLPGVQSIRNGLPNNRPTFNFPPRPHESNSGIPFGNFYPRFPSSNDRTEANSEDQNSPTAPTIGSSTEKSRTKLTPIVVNTSTRPEEPSTKTLHDGSGNTITIFSIKSTTIPFVVTVCGFIATISVFLGYICRHRLCAISKTLKKSKEKEELAKKSNQSQTSNTLSDDGRNSMVMQQWQGPVAFANRYVAWELDQPITTVATSQLSTSVTNIGDASAVGAPCGIADPVDNLMPVSVRSGASSAAAENGLVVDINSDHWEFPRYRLKFFNILGEGAFGQVWRCEATDINGFEGITTVAVKTLKESATEVDRKDLLSELEVMKSLEPHVNVVRLLGCCTDKDPTFVIIEYVNRGKLQSYLRNSRAERHYGNTHGKSNILTSCDLTSFMYQIAKGMDYLTSRGIIHRDLAARNILISDDHTCKVADFGFARDIITSKIYERKSEGKLPIRWMATESLYDNIFSIKSDIWSFGILMWEIVTLGSTPYPGISAADVMRKVRDGYRLEKPEHCRRELYNIMYYCWSQDPHERPLFGEIINMLDKLLHTEMDYIELERFPDHNYYNIVNISGEKL
ncbi:tyrosine kinase receptor Cad96Ca isoform X2 [Drosophila obscura]|nr:tyrosine kinase receptor Cad96Ca isoform X2 [Drosophila obscura]XP_022219360.2 tyrosine kinase receptor Cad96Ca isoform X2 [Drosophila obscura]XP_022219361.2 tyrosine kinase receptor Cad96Ca isoform X2 [Drosophila obscura]XP_022219362.2 tyrosine kinase receptor Cad96Ca isoform X2 [Drosophila obscura]XP_022219364.2 tyrosine kinase receptor Cad96Ca isoform X2 [Drosophila obscura]XP_022219365.2 tyrosine kinase receptor Cad96Ca isoform X2 [Drosophila obscura]